jgi:CDP-diglyceride synthetase
MLLIPLYIANAALLIVMRQRMLGRLHALDAPVCERAFGKTRTWLGIVLMLVIVTIGYALLLGKLCVFPALGMIAGVHAASLLKRLVGMKDSAPFPPVDQLDFFVGGVAGLALCGVYLLEPLLVAIITFIVHLFSNMIAYKAGLKDVWW